MLRLLLLLLLHHDVPRQTARSNFCHKLNPQHQTTWQDCHW
jgi:hypothetical protein